MHGVSSLAVFPRAHEIASRLPVRTDQKITASAAIFGDAVAVGFVHAVGAQAPGASLMLLHVPTNRFMEPILGIISGLTHGSPFNENRTNHAERQNPSIFCVAESCPVELLCLAHNAHAVRKLATDRQGFSGLRWRDALSPAPLSQTYAAEEL